MFVSRPAILHADLDAFFASVEQRDDPRLRGRPVIVGGGVVLAASYEARACGVRSAMGGRRARQMCPDAVVVRPRFSAYVEASREVFAILDEAAPVVEQISIDEAFLDVTGLEAITGTPEQIARRLRTDVRREVGLPISIGAATSKHVAKIASGAAKPDGLLLVAPGTELAFLHPLPVERMWGVGPATQRRLNRHGIRTIGDLARFGEAGLVRLLGLAGGRRLHALAQDRDPRAVRRGRRRRSFGSQRALGRGLRTPEELDATLVALTDRVMRRMRAAGRIGRTVVLRVRFGDYTRASRSRTLARATALTRPVLATLRRLLRAAQPAIEQRGITLLGVAVTNIEEAVGGVQLELPFDGVDHPALDAVVDAVRDRYGSDALQRAALLEAGEELEAYLMPFDRHPR
ncbi:DNA polymerase IV [Capillimicrobium parvum]|uniref:DNA polymerase IV n=1 Tax=Capillimicrobium parvum TaxID=2884022 RepID=UPI003898F7A6